MKRMTMLDTRNVQGHGLLEKDKTYSIENRLADQLIHQGLVIEDVEDVVKPVKTKTGAKK